MKPQTRLLMSLLILLALAAAGCQASPPPVTALPTQVVEQVATVTAAPPPTTPAPSSETGIVEKYLPAEAVVIPASAVEPLPDGDGVIFKAENADGQDISVTLMTNTDGTYTISFMGIPQPATIAGDENRFTIGVMDEVENVGPRYITLLAVENGQVGVIWHPDAGADALSNINPVTPPPTPPGVSEKISTLMRVSHAGEQIDAMPDEPEEPAQPEPTATAEVVEQTPLQQEFEALLAGEAPIGEIGNLHFSLYTGDSSSNVITLADGRQYKVEMTAKEIYGENRQSDEEAARLFNEAISKLFASSNGLIGTNIMNPELPPIVGQPSRIKFHLVTENFPGLEFRTSNVVKYRSGESPLDKGGIAEIFVFYEGDDTQTAHIMIRAYNFNLTGEKFPSDWQTDEILALGIKNFTGRFFRSALVLLLNPPQEQEALWQKNANLVMESTLDGDPDRERKIEIIETLRKFLTLLAEQIN